MRDAGLAVQYCTLLPDFESDLDLSIIAPFQSVHFTTWRDGLSRAKTKSFNHVTLRALDSDYVKACWAVPIVVSLVIFSDGPY